MSSEKHSFLLFTISRFNSRQVRELFPILCHLLCSNPLKDPQVLAKRWTEGCSRLETRVASATLEMDRTWTIGVGPVFHFYVDIDLCGIDLYERYGRYCRILRINKGDSHCPLADLFAIADLFSAKTER